MDYRFSEDELEDVRAVHPNFKISSSGMLHGLIEFDRIYRGYRIKDSYEVMICAYEGYPDKMPMMCETGGRTDEIAEKYSLTDPMALHRNLVGLTACVCVKQEEKIKYPPGSNVLTFIESLAIPYLYGLSFYDEQGYWPWGEYGHGYIGLLEAHADLAGDATINDVQQILRIIKTDVSGIVFLNRLKSLNPMQVCFCGKEEVVSICHPLAWRGILRLRSDIDRLGILL